jgi:predicted nucleic acid-binding protein
MRLILDSSVVIAAVRRGDTVEQLIEKIVKATGDQAAALSAIGLTELIHGIYRAQTPEMRVRRESFLHELLADLTLFPYTKETRGCWQAKSTQSSRAETWSFRSETC